jgi:hypothetical protein
MRLGIGLSEGTLALGEAERNIPECVPVATLDGVNVPDGRNARNCAHSAAFRTGT